MAILSMYFIVIGAYFVYLFCKEKREKAKKVNRTEVEGIKFEFDFPDYAELVENIKKLPADCLQFLAAENYQIYILDDMYSKLFKLKDSKFDLEFDYDCTKCYHIDNQNRIILLKNSDGDDTNISIIQNVYYKQHFEGNMIIRGINIIFDSTIKMRDFTLKALEKIPRNCLEKFAAESFTLYILCEQSFAKKYGEGAEKTAGYFSSKDLEMVIKECDYKDSFFNTFYHEWGHFIDRFSAGKYRKYSTVWNKKIEEFYKQAKESFADRIRDYYLSDISEFFAYMSSEYFLERDMPISDMKVVFESTLAAVS